MAVLTLDTEAHGDVTTQNSNQILIDKIIETASERSSFLAYDLVPDMTSPVNFRLRIIRVT